MDFSSATQLNSTQHPSSMEGPKRHFYLYIFLNQKSFSNTAMLCTPPQLLRSYTPQYCRIPLLPHQSSPRPSSQCTMPQLCTLPSSTMPRSCTTHQLFTTHQLSTPFTHPQSSSTIKSTQRINKICCEYIKEQIWNNTSTYNPILNYYPEQ